jgi:hypothetical protein
MKRGRSSLGKILVPALVFLMLCGIVAGEFPELLSLTDNATNDFTVIRTKSGALPALLHACSHHPSAQTNCATPAPSLLFPCLSPLEETLSIPSKRSALHSVLRT